LIFNNEVKIKTITLVLHFLFYPLITLLLPKLSLNLILLFSLSDE
jgi:hypothetical protein